MNKTIMIKIIVFMVLTFVLSILLALLQEVLKIDYNYLTLPQWGPGLAAILLSFTIFRNINAKTVGLKTYTLARLVVLLTLPFALMGVGYVVGNALNLIPQNAIQVDFKALYIVIPASLFGAFGEALGWRRYLQSSLDKHFDHFKSAILVGLLWGLWHVGNYSNGFVYMALFLVFTMCASLVLSLVIRKFDYNVVLASTFHLSINLGFYIFFKAYLNDINMMLVNALVWLIVSVIVMTLLRDKKIKTQLPD